MATDAENENNFFSCLKLEKEGFPDLCRVCMCKNKNMKSMFCPKLIKSVEELEFCTGILVTISDGLPTLLCDTCFKNLSIASKFKTACLFADKVFKKILEQTHITNSTEKGVVDCEEPMIIKQEVDRFDDEDDDFFNDNEDLETKVSPKPRKTPKPKRKTKKDLTKEKDERNLECDVCGVKFPKQQFLNKHKLDAHGLRMTQNEITDKKAAKSKPKSKVKEDGSVGEKSKNQGLSCDICEVNFESKGLLSKHKKDLHSCECICEICGKQFRHRPSLYSHIKSHMPPEHGCPHCDYKTWHNADLKKHIRIHTGEKKYVCEYCTSSFHTASNMRSHIRRAHAQTKSARHACPRCARTFHVADRMRRHLDTHDNIKRYECDVCYVRFSRRNHWKRHLNKQHSISVPFLRPGRRKSNVVTGDYDPVKSRQMTAPTKLIENLAVKTV